jgi:hypothetical protein
MRKRKEKTLNLAVGKGLRGMKMAMKRPSKCVEYEVVNGAFREEGTGRFLPIHKALGF